MRGKFTPRSFLAPARKTPHSALSTSIALCISLVSPAPAAMAAPSIVAELSAASASRATAVSGDVPDPSQSYFVPQSGSITAPTEGAAAIANARRCPATGSSDLAHEGTQVLKLNARLKVVVIGTRGLPMPGIAASDICVLFNGGTPAQGFTGMGDDSIIANSEFNPVANCPDVRCIPADAPTDANGVAYITWIGAIPGQPGVGQYSLPDPTRRWGGYAGDIPVMVLGVQLRGKLTYTSPLGSYTAHVKNLDFMGGRTTVLNKGEEVNSLDINPVRAAIGHGYEYQMDFDNNGFVDLTDLNFINAHKNHKCNSPM